MLRLTNIVKDPSVFFCPVLEANTPEAYFAYKTQKPLWMNSLGRPDFANWTISTTFTSYIFWAGFGVQGQLAPQLQTPQAANGALVVYGNPSDLFAYDIRSPAKTMIAMDMIGNSDNTPWVVAGNHLDGRTHKVLYRYGGPGVYKPTQAYGGNTLYNDTHVVWRPSENCTFNYRLSGALYPGTTNFAF